MKFKSPHHYLFSIILIATGLYFSSCRKMDATYADYIKDGETIYAGKADSLRAYPGKSRIKLFWPLKPDSKITRAMIYWNNRADSLDYSIDRTSDIRSANVIINNLAEGSYSFDVYTFDNKGNTSVKAIASATVYGNNYIRQLQDRKLKTVLSRNFNAYINWADTVKGAVATETIYTDDEGNTKSILIPMKENQTVLENYKASTEIKYRTLFVPEGISIDTFYTAYSTVIPENSLDKSKFSRWNPAGFPYTEYNSGTGYNIEKLWDDVYTGYGYIYLETQPLPRSFTFDLGLTAKLERLRLSPNWDTQLYKNGNVRKFQIWGSATPSVTTDFSTWIFLGEFNSTKPSGLPLGQTNAADLAYAKAGEFFDIIPSAAPVRYIRFVIQNTWSGSISMHATELTFWGNATR
ncbi:MAG TPA: DUF4998 domain-containing protein [Pedobacter sp.]|uniref:DUF4998 domain-containing protein n=1 Tax=Pedobacter sp. TaxID=1411316 RepID=UPI002C561A99|nr:DUF4998 domain-containing protein [Pedobacter sp.]HMI05437.1 DUF4998 domain-containing protein [Pedobacter sp.]